jgi:hypothetical protein
MTRVSLGDSSAPRSESPQASDGWASGREPDPGSAARYWAGPAMAASRARVPVLPSPRRPHGASRGDGERGHRVGGLRCRSGGRKGDLGAQEALDLGPDVPHGPGGAARGHSRHGPFRQSLMIYCGRERGGDLSRVSSAGMRSRCASSGTRMRSRPPGGSPSPTTRAVRGS